MLNLLYFICIFSHCYFITVIALENYFNAFFIRFKYFNFADLVKTRKIFFLIVSLLKTYLSYLYCRSVSLTACKNCLKAVFCVYTPAVCDTCSDKDCWNLKKSPKLSSCI